MPLQIRSTKLVEDGKGGATVEIDISDNEEADKAVERLLIRACVPIREDSFLPAIQGQALKRTKAILDEADLALRKYWAPH